MRGSPMTKFLLLALAIGACLFLSSIGAVKLQPVGDQCGFLPHKKPELPKPLPAIPNAVLRHVSVIIRHGDRLPAAHKAPTYACWPNAPEWHCDFEPQDLTSDTNGRYRIYQRKFMPGRNLNPGTCFQGQLTDRGIWQEVLNGKILRQRYITEARLLPATFDPALAYLRTDDVPRVILSAEALLMGLWPVNASQPVCASSTPTPWNLNLMDLAVENILPNAAVCPLVGELRTAFQKSELYQNHMKEISMPLDTTIGKLINVPLKYLTPDTVMDCFITHACHDLEFPNGLTQELYNAAMDDEVWIYGALMNYTSPQGTNWATLAMGSFVKDVMSELDEALNGGSGRKFALYAGHDTSILPFLRAFDIWDGQWPRYASMVRIEIHQSTQDSSYLVRVVYNDKEMKLPGCNYITPCPFSIFQSIAKKIIASQSECEKISEPDTLRRSFGIRE